MPLNSQPSSKFVARLEANLPLLPQAKSKMGISPPGEKKQKSGQRNNPAL
jgi:hypothetical protein